jgi:DNA-binding MarR family transcriptional regulator
MTMSQPHFDSHSVAPPPALEPAVRDPALSKPAGESETLGALLMRTAECLTALVQGPTAQAGLNESRYRVLDVLRRKASGTCSQTELATQLLQSESNLSTLLERMRKDGLISRVRSESDRRMALIGLSEAGAAALNRADPARLRAMATVLRVFDGNREDDLSEALRLLLATLERALGLTGRATRRTNATFTSNGHPS